MGSQRVGHKRVTQRARTNRLQALTTLLIPAASLTESEADLDHINKPERVQTVPLNSSQ